MCFISRCFSCFQCATIDTRESVVPNVESRPHRPSTPPLSSMFSPITPKSKSKSDIHAPQETIYISFCFPSENNTTFRLKTVADEPVRIPNYIANFIKVRGLPFEVTVYDHEPSHIASFFFLPYAFEKVEEYARRRTRNSSDSGIESYEITPQYQQEPHRRASRYYDAWIEYVPDGTPLKIRVVVV